MVSGIGTSSGFEERIRFSELEIVDSNAIETGVMHTMPEGNYINGWDVNVAGVRVTSEKRTIRHHKHAEFLLRIKKKGELEHFVGRRYSDFSKLHKRVRIELPGRVIPELPKKNKSDTTTTGLMTMFGNGNDSDASSVSSVSTRLTGLVPGTDGSTSRLSPRGLSSALRPGRSSTDNPEGHKRDPSTASARSKGVPSPARVPSPQQSTEGKLSPLPAGQDKQEVYPIISRCLTLLTRLADYCSLA